MILRIQLLFLLFKFVFNYNFDVDYPIIYEYPNKTNKGSYFGLSVALREKIYFLKDSWVLQIGAPRANVSNSKFNETGAVFRCSLHGPCQFYYVDKDDVGKGGFGDYAYETRKERAFIGVSMDVKETKAGGKNVICGHRWANNDIKFKIKNFQMDYTYLMTGACYLTNNSEHGRIDALKMLPLVNRDKILHRDKYYWGLGQAGISVELDEDLTTVIMGAPGITWSGGVIKYNINSYPIVEDFKGLDHLFAYAYGGYQIGKGRFFGDGKLWYLAGAPRSNGYKGEVIIFKFEYSRSEGKYNNQRLQGKTVGEYFGASLLVTDIDSNGIDDIIVGAPCYSSKEPDQGKIYVFLGSSSKGSHKGKLIHNEYSESHNFVGKAAYGRFGSCISALDDFDKDGFRDVAVGAPYENNNRGAVYIYRGTPYGLQYGFKILAEEVYEGLRGFGMSISKGIDVDENSWRDLAVGAYLSDQVVLLRSRPVISLQPSIQSDTSLLTRENVLFFKINVCSKYDGAHLPEAINVTRSIRIDPNYRRVQIALTTQTNGQPVETKKIIQLHFNKTYCEEFQLFVLPQILNTTFSNPVEIILTNELSKCSEKKKKILFIKGENNNLQKEDDFMKWCPVETRSEVFVKIPFAGECGTNNICEANLEISCSIVEARNNLYTVGRSKYITLLINVKNSKEPAYNTKILVASNFDFDSSEFDSYQEWRVDEFYKNVTWLNIDYPLGANFEGEVKLEINTDRIQQRKFTENHLDVYVKAESTSVEVDRFNNECKVSLELLCDLEVFLVATSPINTFSVSADLDNPLINFTHYYEVSKTGVSPAGIIELTINIPITYFGVEIASIRTEKPEGVQQWSTEDRIVDRFAKENPVFESKLSSSENLSSNRTLFLNCSTPSVECISLELIFPDGIQTDIPSLVNVFITLNYSEIDSFMGDKDNVYFTTDAVLKVPQHCNFDSLELSADTSTNIFKEKLIKKSVETYVIALSVLGGGLLLSLIISGLLKSDFFRRKKREELKALKSNEMFEMQQKFINEEAK